MPTPPPALPRRVAWFAPWTWRRRTRRATGTGAVIVAYLLSAGPAFYFLLRQPFPGTTRAYEVVYAPALWLSDRCPPLKAFYLSQWGWINDRHARDRIARERRNR